MSAHREALRARRAYLQERAASERAELAALFDQWATPLHAVERGLSLVRAVCGSPLLRFGVGAGMVALAITRPRSIRSWNAGGQAVWRLLTCALHGALRTDQRPLLPDLWLACHPQQDGRRQ
jgi:hypothetical protein